MSRLIKAALFSERKFKMHLAYKVGAGWSLLTKIIKEQTKRNKIERDR